MKNKFFTKEDLKLWASTTIGLGFIAFAFKKDGFKLGQKNVLDKIKTSGLTLVNEAGEVCEITLNK